MKKASATTWLSSSWKCAQHRAGVGLGQEQQQQPDDALADQSTTLDARYGHVQRLGAAEPLDVLGRLLLEDVGHVVLGDDPEQAVVVVHDRHGQQVAVGQQPRGDLPVGIGPDADRRRRHELADRRRAGAEQQADTATARRAAAAPASTT